MHHLHIALNVRSLEDSVAFYAHVFGLEPDKEAPGYARFTIPDPALVLTLNAKKKVIQGERVSHLGVRLASREVLEGVRDRLQEAGLVQREEHEVLCCHAVQEKVWVTDPDGNQWEFYELLQDLDPSAPAPRGRGGCC